MTDSHSFDSLRWRMALWDRKSTEPALLRVPLVLIFFIGLWGLNVWAFEQRKIQYHAVLGLKSSPLIFVSCITMALTISYVVIMQFVVGMLEISIEQAVVLFYTLLFIFCGLVPCMIPRQQQTNTRITATYTNDGAHNNLSTQIIDNGNENTIVGFPIDTNNNNSNVGNGQINIDGSGFYVLIQNNITGFFRLLRQAIFPSSAVKFPEILLADALCSLSKVFKDLGVTLIVIYAGFTNVPVVSLHENGVLLVAIMASFPYVVRVRQCWVQFTGHTDPILKISVALNIIKYMSAFPPIILAASTSLGYNYSSLPKITAAASAINSLYSYLWDIIMDWGLIQFNITGFARQRNGQRKCNFIIWRQQMFYPLILYVFAAVINLVLRFSWMANQFHYFQRFHAMQLVLLIELAEVLRRSMWNMFRVEWEIISKTEIERSVSKGDDELLKKNPPFEIGVSTSLNFSSVAGTMSSVGSGDEPHTLAN